MKKKRFIISILLFMGFISTIIGCGSTVYTVTFVVDDSAKLVVIADDNILSELPEEPSKDYYTFDGWYLDEEYNEKFTAPAKITSNTRVYAKFTAITYTITYLNELGLDNPDPTLYNVESTSITLASFGNENYTLLGWYDEEGELVTTISPARAENIELTALLIENEKINVIQYTEKKSFKLSDEINASTFDVFCFDEKGEYYDVTCTVNGNIAVGEEISVTLSVRGDNEIAPVTINNIRIYGTPTIETVYTDYIYLDQAIPSSFTALDSFGETLDVVITGNAVEGGTVTATAIDAAGNEVSKTISVIKASTDVFTFFYNSTQTFYNRIAGLTAYGKEIENLVIPGEISGVTVTQIENSAFANNTNLISVVLSNSITFLDTEAFYNCTSLTTIYMPNELVQIGNSTFRNCTNLKSVNLPESIRFIGNFPFYGCTNLESIYIPDGVLNIGEDAFLDCNKLTIYCEGSGPYDIGTDAWYPNWNNSNRPVVWNYVANTIHYNLDSENIKVTEKSKLLEESLNAYCGNFSETYDVSYFIEGEVIAGNTVKITLSVGNSAIEDKVIYVKIYGAPTLESEYKNIIYYDQVTASSFTAKDSFNESITLELPSSYSISDVITVTATDAAGNEVSIELTVLDTIANVFIVDGNTITGLTEYGKSLTNLIIPSVINEVEITSIAAEAFSGNETLENITLPNTITTIGYMAFYNCNKLTSIVIPEKVTKIEYSTFEGCSSIISIKLHEGITSIASYAFKNCSQLTDITLPEKLTSLAKHLFYGCTSLASINIPSSVTKLIDSAFMNCTSLTSIYISSNITAIEVNVFKGSTNLIIYCEILEEDKPDTWDEDWNPSACQVVWGYTPGETK